MICLNCHCYFHTTPKHDPVSVIPSSPILAPLPLGSWSWSWSVKIRKLRRSMRRRRGVAVCGFLGGVDPWAPSIDSQSIASQLFALSLFPYLGFLYFLTNSHNVPKLTLFGFYFLLAFVAATIPAGIYAKVHYGTSLSNVDWLHGCAESLLTLSNLFVVLGLRNALRETEVEPTPSDNETQSQSQLNEDDLFSP